MNIFPILWRLFKHKFCSQHTLNNVHAEHGKEGKFFNELEDWRKRNNLFFSEKLSKAFLIYSLSFSFVSLFRFISFFNFSRFTLICVQIYFALILNLYLTTCSLLCSHSYSFVGVCCLFHFAICYVLHILLLFVDEKLPKAVSLCVRLFCIFLRNCSTIKIL